MRIADCPDDRDQAGDPHPFTAQVLGVVFGVAPKVRDGFSLLPRQRPGEGGGARAGAVTLLSSLLLLMGRGLSPEPRFPLCKVDRWGW